MAKAKARDKSLDNPLTGQPANTFTQSTNRTLPAPTASRPFGPTLESVNSTKASPISPEELSNRSKRNIGATREFNATGRQLRAGHQEALEQGVPDAQIGYQKPKGMSDASFAWISGGHHMFPNEAARRNEPAINEPHDANPGVTVQRRAEDLSGPEYRKGEQVLAHYGHDAKDPVGSLQDTQARLLNRTMAEHVQAGVDESSSHMFYGGTPHKIEGDPDMDFAHRAGVMEGRYHFEDAVHDLTNHAQFASRTSGMSPGQKQSAATNIMAQATTDTSPNTKWRIKDSWPNMDQAQEAIDAGLTGRVARPFAGRPDNVRTATGRVAEMMDSPEPSRHAFGNPVTSPKTVAFGGALVDRDSPDAYKVSDVHEGSNISPSLTTAKSIAHSGHASGKNVNIHPDDPARRSNGLTPIYDQATGKNKVGLSRPEEMLAKGRSTIHALNDYASRAALANAGLSRGTNYADNVHAMQAATWGSQQMLRHDVDISHANQYPVVRNWAAEGHNVPHGGDIRNMGTSHTSSNLGEQFVANPNTTARSRSPKTAHLVNPTKSKPYPVMPGEVG